MRKMRFLHSAFKVRVNERQGEMFMLRPSGDSQRDITSGTEPPLTEQQDLQTLIGTCKRMSRKETSRCHMDPECIPADKEALGSQGRSSLMELLQRG